MAKANYCIVGIVVLRFFIIFKNLLRDLVELWSLCMLLPKRNPVLYGVSHRRVHFNSLKQCMMTAPRARDI